MYQEILNDILDRIDAIETPIFTADEIAAWPESSFKLLLEIGFLTEVGLLEADFCQDCELGCLEEIILIGEGLDTKAYMICHQRDDIGRIPVPLEKLKRWAVDVELIAKYLAVQYKTNGRFESIMPNMLWHLGYLRLKRDRIDVFFLRTSNLPTEFGSSAVLEKLKGYSAPLVIVPHQIPDDLPPSIKDKTLALSQVLSFHDGQLTLEEDRIFQLLIDGQSTRKRRVKVVTPIYVPSDTTWKEVQITFLDENQVKVCVRDKVEFRDYDDMGFSDNRKRGTVPDKLWLFLSFTAGRDGRISWDDSDHRLPSKRGKVKDMIANIRERLRALFPDISGNPIIYDKQDQAYKTVFKLDKMTAMDTSGW